MKQLLFLIALVVMCAGCKRGIPGSLIQPAEMEQILYSIHVADAIVGNIPRPDSAKLITAVSIKNLI
jgi:hypothetical protein